MATAKNNSDAPDLVSVGRISVDLYGEQVGSGLAEAATFRRYIGGSAGNTAVGSSRLGVRTAMMARIGADGFGDYLVKQLQREGIDTRAVVRDPNRTTGTIALAMHEGGDFPRSFLVADPAEFALEAADVDHELVASARSVLVTGSLLSRPNLAEVARALIATATTSETEVIYDIDYRPAFWGVVPRHQGENLTDFTPEVTTRLQEILGDCDVVIGTEAELCALGGSTDIAESLRAVRALTSALIVYKVGPRGCLAYPGAIPEDLDEGLFSPGFGVEVVNSVGAGDAFMSGFLRGYLGGEDLPTTLRWANANGAIVVGRPGCSGSSPSMAELSEFLDRADADRAAGRLTPAVSIRQFDTVTRHRHRERLRIMAIDHRGHLERVAARAGKGAAEIRRFKEITLDGFLAQGAGLPDAGVLVDDVYTSRLLRERLGDSGVWTARALELSGRAPVQFDGGGDVAGYLTTWPREQVVKVLVVTSATEDPAVGFTNRERLRLLTAVCRGLERDLLIEILPSPGARNSGADLAHIIEDWYRAGIRPAWWKLPAVESVEDWRALDAIVARYDDECRGFLVLGGSTDPETLTASFAPTREVESVRGFAVGRPIFHAPAEEWFAGRIDDAEASARIIANYRETVALWDAR